MTRSEEYCVWEKAVIWHLPRSEFAFGFTATMLSRARIPYLCGTRVSLIGHGGSAERKIGSSHTCSGAELVKLTGGRISKSWFGSLSG